MTEFVWIDDLTAELHVSFMSPHNYNCWLLFDPQSIERAGEPTFPNIYALECLGELYSHGESKK